MSVRSRPSKLLDMDSSHAPRSGPFPPATSNSEVTGQSSSQSGQELRRLSFRGQMIKVILPSETPDTANCEEDIIKKASHIQERDAEDVSFRGEDMLILE